MSKLRTGIVGAGGQVGPTLLSYLSGDPRIQVFGVCRNEVSAGPLRMEGHDIRCGSVTDPATAADLLGDCDVIVNCSATSGTPARKSVAERSMLRALCGLPGRKRLIHFSSVAAYGGCIDARRNTFEHPRPDQPYGRHKLDLERYLWRCLRASAHEAVVLRLGHVYGAGQWLSRFVLEASRDPRFRLPFDGRLASNAVHVRNVGAAIRRLILDWPQTGTYNLFDAPATTWRDVFDWNTNAVGVLPVAAMSDEESERVATHYRRQAARSLGARLASEITSWMRTLPGSFISACPAVKTLGILTLATLRQEWLERQLLRRHKIRAARAGGVTPDIPGLDSWLLSEGAPGAQIAYRGEREIEDPTAVAAWYRRYAEPDAILNWDAPSIGVSHTPLN
jgi:nucleoside-diphosphate-sugar epimerase